MSQRKPKEKDFKIGEPITDEEREVALRKMLDERVDAMRRAAYKAAEAEWLWANGLIR